MDPATLRQRRGNRNDDSFITNLESTLRRACSTTASSCGLADVPNDPADRALGHRRVKEERQGLGVGVGERERLWSTRRKSSPRTRPSWS